MSRSGRDFLSFGEEKEVMPPTMARSRGQLSAAYAPGAFFTFEGGLGACISLPDVSSTDTAPIDEQTKTQILLRLREIWQSWFSRAYSVRSTNPEVDARQCVEQALLRGEAIFPLDGAGIEFLSPLSMGYAPAPLTFVCNKCQLFKRFKDTQALTKSLPALRRAKCQADPRGGACQWRQLDVIFVHWSGEWMPATPGRWEWNDHTGKARLAYEECSCGSDSFKLHTSSPQIGKWYFSCARCGTISQPEWRQNDQTTTTLLGATASRRNSERRMEPISYRASSAYYPQSEQFIMFAKHDQQLLSLLEPDRHAELRAFIGSKYGFSGTPLTSEEIQEALVSAGKPDEWTSYERFAKLRDSCIATGDAEMAKMFEEEMNKLVSRWTTQEPPLLLPSTELPASIQVQISSRAEYTSRFDPFVLAVEHEALVRGKLSAGAPTGRKPFVRFNHLDNDLAPKDLQEKIRQESETKQLMDRLGFSEFGLIREFELCRFTHGYSRVSPLPVIEKRGELMPVRLRLFDPMKNGKRPLYVVTQQNEAIYVQLDPRSVYGWLSSVGTLDLLEWTTSSEVKLGGRILEVAQPFGRFFSRLKEDDSATYRYVYTLLHTFAHTFMKNIAELSGLDLGSLGEYIFPADLAFVVYRNGTTMDLGNLSSLWRNENNRFLSRFLETAEHRCNSGRVCDSRGGACPDCIMVPETSCIAQNQLLSRAVLIGGSPPREDKTHKGVRIPGYLEFLNATAG